MIKNYILFFLGLVILLSCNNNLEKEKGNNTQHMNELVITAKGDSLENEYWIYDKGKNGISKRGMYNDGYKINEWIYKIDVDSVTITWDTFNDKGVKFNIPNYIKP